MVNNFVKKVLLLNIQSIKDKYGIYSAVMPFFNEIVNLLTITILKPNFGVELYFHNPVTMLQRIINSIGYILSISGIIANSTNYTVNYNKYKGLFVGVLYTIFSFIIPNLLLQKMLSPFHNNYVKLFTGIIIIYLLDVLIHFIVYLYTKYIKKKQKIK